MEELIWGRVGQLARIQAGAGPRWCHTTLASQELGRGRLGHWAIGDPSRRPPGWVAVEEGECRQHLSSCNRCWDLGEEDGGEKEESRRLIWKGGEPPLRCCRAAACIRVRLETNQEDGSATRDRVHVIWA
jgi:hypothetical protein